MDLEKEIIEIIASHLGVSLKEISKEVSLTEDLNASHLEIADLILALEEKFQIKIPEEEVENLKKVEDIVSYILEHYDEPSPI